MVNYTLLSKSSQQKNASSSNSKGIWKFEELPISQQTRRSLREKSFFYMTAIQKAMIPCALCGKDILGSAKTGSGKTLAFLIPLIEKLYRQSWENKDGIGGLILAPSRELALQIFEEICKLCKHHSFKSGLLIGGKTIKEERHFIHDLNILIGTPGRILQHMDLTQEVDMSKIQDGLRAFLYQRALDLSFGTYQALYEDFSS